MDIQANDKIFLRSGNSDDISEIHSIIKLELPNGVCPSVNDLLNGFSSSQPWFSVLVAETDGQIAGCALYCRSYWPRPAPAGRAVLLRMLCVRQNARRRGLGTKLFKELCRVALKDNAQLNWSHAPSNTAAAAFFAQFKPGINHTLDKTHFLRIAPKDALKMAAEKISSDQDVSVKLARKEDMAELHAMIQEIAVILDTLNPSTLTVNDFIKDGVTSTPPWFFALMAWRQGAIVGLVIGHRAYNWTQSIDMKSMYVRPAARRCGVANELVVAFCRMAEESNAHVDLKVYPGHQPAMKLYRSWNANRLPLFDGHVDFRLEIHHIKDILHNE